MAASFESFYNGGGDRFLPPEYGTIQGSAFKMNASRLGVPGMATTADQLGQAALVLKSGVRAFEVSNLGMSERGGEDPIPKPHFEEIRALLKLSGVKPSLHGPLIDPSGVEGNRWTGEEGRRDSERRMMDAMEKAHTLSYEGNVPIVFHASNTGGREYRMENVLDENGKVMKDENGNPVRNKVLVGSIAINKDTGEVVQLKRDFQYNFGDPDSLRKGGKEQAIERVVKGQLEKPRIESLNSNYWDQKITEVQTIAKTTEEILQPVLQRGRESLIPLIDPTNSTPEEIERAKITLSRAGTFVQDNLQNLSTLFHKAYKYGDENQREKLEKLSRDYKDKMDKLGKNEVSQIIGKQQFVNEATKELNEIFGRGAPKIFTEIEDFAMDKSAETFSNLTVNAYKKWGESAPIMAIENLPEHMGFNDPDQLTKLVKKTREDTIKTLSDKKVMGDKVMNEKQAKQYVDKHLGVTWDLGHINTLKKRGFTDADVIKATENLSKDKSMVKHLHLSDNFGFSDSDLAPGMGNVPFKKHLEQLEKIGKLDEMNKIIEAHTSITQFRTNPFGITLASMSSPIYGMKMGPTWNQLGGRVMGQSIGGMGMGNYAGGFGNNNPDTHHSIYGGGFTALPLEVGGQIAGGASRFGGAPMA